MKRYKYKKVYRRGNGSPCYFLCLELTYPVRQVLPRRDRASNRFFMEDHITRY